MLFQDCSKCVCVCARVKKTHLQVKTLKEVFEDALNVTWKHLKVSITLFI